MLCCALIAGLFGLLWPWRRGALAWRPGEGAPLGFVRARWRSIGFAMAGLGFAIRNEANMRTHLAGAASAIAAGLAFGIDAAEWRWLILAIAPVIAGEALNTGIEQACDAIGGRSEAIRRAKDAAAGGVLVLAIGAALIGASIFAPHVLAAWRGAPIALPLCSAF